MKATMALPKFLLTYKAWNGKLGIEEFKTHIFEAVDYDSAWSDAFETFGHCLVSLKTIK